MTTILERRNLGVTGVLCVALAWFTQAAVAEIPTRIKIACAALPDAESKRCLAWCQKAVTANQRTCEEKADKTWSDNNTMRSYAYEECQATAVTDYDACSDLAGLDTSSSSSTSEDGESEGDGYACEEGPPCALDPSKKHR